MGLFQFEMRTAYFDSAKLLSFIFFNISVNDFIRNVPGSSNVALLDSAVIDSNLRVANGCAKSAAWCGHIQYGRKREHVCLQKNCVFFLKKDRIFTVRPHQIVR